MFIKIKDKNHLIEELRKRIGEELVFHYICDECDDEQVSYETEIDEDIINELVKNDYLMVWFNCTECGTTTKFLYSDNIFGIELDF